MSLCAANPAPARCRAAEAIIKVAQTVVLAWLGKYQTITYQGANQMNLYIDPGTPTGAQSATVYCNNQWSNWFNVYVYL